MVELVEVYPYFHDPSRIFRIRATGVFTARIKKSDALSRSKPPRIKEGYTLT